MAAVLKKLKDLPRGRNLNFMSGSVTWKECAIILKSLLIGSNLAEGEEIRKYEDEFSRYLGTKYAFSFGAGRMAFYAILKALGVANGDEVILPGYTCVVVPDAVVYCGAKPIYVDIDRSTLNIDVDKIEERISSRTKVIYAQHTFGSFCKMEEIMKLAERHHLKVVEDCAHALGAKYDGKKVGTFGHAAYFTTEQSKLMSTGMGGMAVTDDEVIAARIKEIQANSDHYDEQTIKRIALQIVAFNCIFHPWAFYLRNYLLAAMFKLHLYVESTTIEEMEGKMPEKYPVKLSNIQARMGRSQLNGIQKNIEHRYKIAKFYEGWLKTHGYEVPADDNGLYKPSYIRYWFLTADKEELQRHFYLHNVDLGQWFECPIHPRGTSLRNVFYEDGSCPTAEYVVEHNVNLPTHLKVSIADARRIVGILASSSARTELTPLE